MSFIVKNDNDNENELNSLSLSKINLNSDKSNKQINDLSYLKKVENQENNQETSFGDEMLLIDKMVGYKKSIKGKIIYYSTIIFTAGLILLIYYWFDLLYIKLRFIESKFNDSDFILVYSQDSRHEFCKVNKLNNNEKYIIFRYSRFFLNSTLIQFEKSKLINNFEKYDLIRIISSGLSNDEFKNQFEKFGKNEINFVVKSIPKLLLEEVIHPFFIFQLYSVGLWFSEEYYYYAVAIFVIATVSAVINLREIRSNLVSLKKIAYFVCDVTVLRNNQFQTISSTELVPGDIVELKQDFVMPCDVVLLSGQAILNESMLTGESIPVTKYSVLSDDEIKQFNMGTISPTGDLKDLSKEKRSLIFGGTITVKLTPSIVNDKVLGMVRDTAFQTTKGKLILSILYPKKSHFKFFAESLKFIGVLCCLGLVGFALSVWRLHSLGMDAKTIVIRALDLITIVVPPALPMAMSVGTGFGLQRLKKSKIFCISPPRLNMAGKIQVFCFDKTGTLTEEGLDLLGIININHSNQFNKLLVYNCNSKDELFENQTSTSNNNLIFKYLMSSCHSLSVINNQVSGDPLEVKVFESTNSKILESNNSSSGQLIQCKFMNHQENLNYLENFDFQSKLQRMSVIIQLESNKQSFSLVKGSPEMIKGLCHQSTIPKDYDEQLAIYTEKGYRVLACAYKPWDLNQQFSKRELLRLESESNLQFLGFIIMENKLKSKSPIIIQTLNDANIKTVMVTGDNPLTATSVAKQCGIIKKHSYLFMSILQSNAQTGEDEIIWEQVKNGENENEKQNSIRLDFNSLLVDTSVNDLSQPFDYNLIITGPVFRLIYNNYLNTGNKNFVTMLRRGIVYSRMTPDQKQVLVEELMRLKLYVGMCGDGANDCGALKAAHIGISLSESEASIAAPFTSTITDISCCPNLIKEGRASLVVSFKLFQFIGMYSLIQFTTVIILYFIGSVLGNWMYLYQDLWVVFPLVLFMGMTKPCNKLSKKRPSGRLISGDIVGSLLVHITVCVSFQIIIFFLIKHQNWYDDILRDENNIQNYITTSLFIYGCFQCLIMNFTFSFGKPFLKPIYTNIVLFIIYLISLSTTILLLFVPTEKVWEFGELLIVPVSWRFIMFAFIVGNLILNLLVEAGFFFYKSRSKKKKISNLTLVFPKKEIPKDYRILLENSVSIKMSRKNTRKSTISRRL